MEKTPYEEKPYYEQNNKIDYTLLKNFALNKKVKLILKYYSQFDCGEDFVLEGIIEKIQGNFFLFQKITK